MVASAATVREQVSNQPVCAWASLIVCKVYAMQQVEPHVGWIMRRITYDRVSLLQQLVNDDECFKSLNFVR